MLAKETKIHNLIHQRNFIKAQLEGFKKDGDPAYRYLGYVYPENKKYFETEGYSITTITSIEALKIGKGLPLNIFTPFDEIELTPEEETTSERIATEFSNISEELREYLSVEMGDLFKDIFSPLNKEDDSDEVDMEDNDIPEDVENFTGEEEE